MKVVARAVTVEEFSRMRDNGMRRELVRGEVREMSPTKSWHGLTTSNVHMVLGQYVRKKKLGRVFAAETGFLIERDPDTVRAPDCACVRADRLPSPLPNEFLPFAPDLAVEVLSPDDRPKEVREKVGQWLEAGCRAVWVLDPDRREAIVHLPGAEPRVLGEGDFLEGGDLLPGFRIRISKLFE